MVWNLIDQILLIVSIIILIAITDTLLGVIKKDQYIRWINFLGVAIILGLVVSEIFRFLWELRRLLYRF